MTLDKSEFVKQYTILDRISEVKLLVENENWQTALLTTLTLPDICGKIKYPKKTVSDRYRDWFNEHCVQHYLRKKMRPTNIDCFTGEPHWEVYSINAYFKGDMCYKLRNSFLHEGSDVVKSWDNNDDNRGRKEDSMNYEFELNVNGADMHGKINGKLIPFEKADLEIGTNNVVSLNIKKLCNVICDEAYNFLSMKEYKEDIDLYTMNIVDYKKMANAIRSNE